MNLWPIVRSTIEKQSLMDPSEKILVAVSGGPDSISLLHLLKERGYRLHALHVDHGLRGERSNQDRLFVERQCAAWNIPCTVVKAGIPARQKKKKTSLEEAGRTARYKAYLRVAQAAGCGRVATGHTLDDQAETLLFHLVRGTGPKGLKGIPVSRPLGPGVTVVRPFLRVSRAMLISYLRANRLGWRTDETNRNERFARNRLRHRVLPLLESINPQVRKHLGTLAEIMAQEDQEWDSALQTILPLMTCFSGGKFLLDMTMFFSYPVIIQQRLLKGFLELAIPEVKAVHWDQAWTLVKSPEATGAVSLGRGWRLERQHQRLALGQPSPKEKSGWARPLSVPGRVALSGGQGFLKAEWVSSFSRKPHAREAYFDGAACRGKKWLVRYRRPGDRFRPDGLGGTQKLKEFFIDHKVPLSERDRVPLVTCGGEIYWVAGFRRNDQAKVPPEAKKILRLEYVH